MQDDACPFCGSSGAATNFNAAPQPATNPYAQGAQGGNYGGNYGGGYGGRNVPQVNDYLIWNVLLTIFCCRIGGIIGIVFSIQSRNALLAGDYQRALQKASSAKWTFWICFIIGLVGLVAYVALAANNPDLINN